MIMLRPIDTIISNNCTLNSNGIDLDDNSQSITIENNNCTNNTNGKISVSD